VALTDVVGRTVTGLYRDASHVWRPGVVVNLSETDPCRVAIQVPWPEGTRTYDGRFYCDADSPRLRGMIAGIRGSGSLARGFHAIRSGHQSVLITSPAEDSSFARGVTRVDFAADASDAASIQWTSSIDGPLSTNMNFSRLNLSFGEHVISAQVTHTDGDTSSDSVRVTITNDPPTVNVIEPGAGDGPFCVGEAVTFRAAVTDINEPPSYTLPNSAVEWRTAGGAPLGTGKQINHTFSAAGTTNVIVRATDSLGLYDEDNVSVTAEDCPDSPPTVAITVPAADTGTSDTPYAYDGYDNGVGMWYTDVPVTGSATDPEDGTLTGASLVWTTDRTDLQAGGLGTGVSRTVRLYSNVCTGVWHQVTLTATDSNGNSRSAVRRIFIWTLCRRKQP
jgi:serine protease